MITTFYCKIYREFPFKSWKKTNGLPLYQLSFIDFISFLIQNRFSLNFTEISLIDLYKWQLDMRFLLLFENNSKPAGTIRKKAINLHIVLTICHQQWHIGLRRTTCNFFKISVNSTHTFLWFCFGIIHLIDNYHK